MGDLKMKKNLLLSASLLVLAACAGTKSQDVDLTEQNLGVTDSIKHESYNNSTASAYEGIDNAVLSEETLKLREELSAVTDNTVLFSFDSSAVNPEAQAELKTIAGFILSRDNVGKIIIEGHCDERGTREYNLSLGERRAVAIKKYLISLGVNSDLIDTISYGKEQPADASNTPAAWAKNRRGVVLVDAAQ